MKEVMLQAANIIKDMASSYPDYGFSSCNLGVINHGTNAVSICFDATVFFYGTGYIMAKGEDLESLYQDLNAKLVKHSSSLIAA